MLIINFLVIILFEILKMVHNTYFIINTKNRLRYKWGIGRINLCFFIYVSLQKRRWNQDVRTNSYVTGGITK